MKFLENPYVAVAFLLGVIILGIVVIGLLIHFFPAPNPVCHHVFNEVKTYPNNGTHIQIYRCLDHDDET
jgi:hypothetical protein